MLSEGGAEITEGVPADLVKRKQANLERQHEVAQELSGVSLTGEAPKDSVEKLEGELEKLSIEYDSIENQIRAANPRYSTLTAAQPLTLAEVQQRVLDDQTALAEYALGRDNSYLWVVTKSSAALYRLPGREQVERQVAEFRANIVPRNCPLRRRIARHTRGLSDERGVCVVSTPALCRQRRPFLKRRTPSKYRAAPAAPASRHRLLSSPTARQLRALRGPVLHARRHRLLRAAYLVRRQGCSAVGLGSGPWRAETRRQAAVELVVADPGPTLRTRAPRSAGRASGRPRRHHNSPSASRRQHHGAKELRRGFRPRADGTRTAAR